MRGIIFASLIAAGCGGRSDQKVRDVYSCWEIGYQYTQHCTRFGACNDEWFQSTKPVVVVIDNDASFGTRTEYCSKQSGVTIWNQLQPTDVSDETAEILVELQSAVAARSQPGIERARAKLRAQLDLR
jgi:hypothetical protein